MQLSGNLSKLIRDCQGEFGERLGSNDANDANDGKLGEAGISTKPHTTSSNLATCRSDSKTGYNTSVVKSNAKLSKGNPGSQKSRDFINAGESSQFNSPHSQSIPTLIFSHQVIGFTQVRADCTVSPFDIARYVDESAKEISPKLDLSGFRKGKAPVKLIISHKWNAVEKRARERLVEDSVSQITEEIGKDTYSPIAPAEVHNNDSLKIEKLEESYAPLHFTITWPIDARNAMTPDMPDQILPSQPEIAGMPTSAIPRLPGVPYGDSLPDSKNLTPKQ